MKQIIFLFLFLSSKSFAQKSNFHFRAKPDSILQESEYGFIYYTSDTSSIYYNWIIPTIDTEMAHSIQNQYFRKELEKLNLSNSHFSLGSFSCKWNSVYRYQNEYFLYAPSDWMSNSGFYFSDSIIYITKSDWEPATDYIMKDFKLSNEGNATIQTVNLLGQEIDISIYLIDKSLGICQWIFTNQQENETIKFLMQNSEFSKKTRMIVSDCGLQKCFMEFDFVN
jgi:hypothetical protein